MSKAYIAITLKRLRENNTNLTADEVGALIGKSGKTVNAWENGRGQPDAEILIKLCGIYHVNNILAEFDEDNILKKDFLTSDEFKFIKKYRSLDRYGKNAVDSVLNIEYDRCTIPTVEEEETPTLRIKCSVYKVSAGHGFPLDEGDNWNYIDVPDTPLSRQADFALTISGDSMEPIYHDGDVVLVQSQSDVPIGAVGIFMLDGAGYIKKNGGDRLISLNEQYDDIVLSEDHNAVIVGKVIGRA